ncbi:hypothetical protein EJ04DRAFT_507173 [Polyplosphaeria fusca]|uniref:Uncharacterized protein n=1 Tax=Polyplosphaeria fusca TaxID=682080 RepID=A0A9P4R8V6_9PLEO|nr:hypothetical protein EJ04DRAFT_507173 [Polyplosphaeria fusca]
MSFTYSHLRSRDDEPFFTRPLVRRSTKRYHLDSDSDSGHDDYPYGSSHKPSRALTIRQPTSGHLTKYNIWEEPSSKHKSSHKSTKHYDSDSGHDSYKYKYKRTIYKDDEPKYELKYKVKESRPSEESRMHYWPGEVFRGRDKWERVDWEKHERERGGDGWWEEPVQKESHTRYRKLKRSRTNEWRPLGGFRH